MDVINADVTQNMFFFSHLRKKETKLKFVTVL